MQYSNLREFIALLEQRRELVRITQPVSPHLVITEITDRVCKGPAQLNKALLFESLPGYQMPLLINAFGSAQRMAWALGVEELDQLNRDLGKVIDMRLPRGAQETLSRGRDLFKAIRSVGLKPKKVRSGPVQEVVLKDTPSLGYPADPAKTIKQHLLYQI